MCRFFALRIFDVNKNGFRSAARTERFGVALLPSDTLSVCTCCAFGRKRIGGLHSFFIQNIAAVRCGFSLGKQLFIVQRVSHRTMRTWYDCCFSSLIKRIPFRFFVRVFFFCVLESTEIVFHFFCQFHFSQSFRGFLLWVAAIHGNFRCVGI